MDQKTETPPQPSQELTAKVGTVRAFAQMHSLLSNGMFHPRQMKALSNTLQFLEAAHANALEQARAHPDAHLMPELETPKPEATTPEAQNGQAQ